MTVPDLGANRSSESLLEGRHWVIRFYEYVNRRDALATQESAEREEEDMT